MAIFVIHFHISESAPRTKDVQSSNVIKLSQAEIKDLENLKYEFSKEGIIKRNQTTRTRGKLKQKKRNRSKRALSIIMK